MLAPRRRLLSSSAESLPPPSRHAPLTRESDDALRGLLGAAVALGTALWLAQVLFESLL